MTSDNNGRAQHNTGAAAAVRAALDMCIQEESEREGLVAYCSEAGRERERKREREGRVGNNVLRPLTWLNRSLAARCCSRGS